LYGESAVGFVNEDDEDALLSTRSLAEVSDLAAVDGLFVVGSGLGSDLTTLLPLSTLVAPLLEVALLWVELHRPLPSPPALPRRKGLLFSSSAAPRAVCLRGVAAADEGRLPSVS
jgi:hypothetical protein